MLQRNSTYLQALEILSYLKMKFSSYLRIKLKFSSGSILEKTLEVSQE